MYSCAMDKCKAAEKPEQLGDPNSAGLGGACLCCGLDDLHTKMPVLFSLDVNCGSCVTLLCSRRRKEPFAAGLSVAAHCHGELCSWNLIVQLR